MSRKPQQEAERTIIITVKTVPTTVAHMIEGNYVGYEWELIADEGNMGIIFIGKNEMNCTFPMRAGDNRITRADLDKLWWYSENGTEKMHIWGEVK